MSDPALLIDSFVAFANCPRYVAEQYLAKHAYDVSAALEGYYRNEDGDENSPRRASPAPTSGIRTFRDLLGDSNDEHRTAQNFFTGGEKSALQVENPDKNDPKKRAAGLVDRIFQRARDQLSEPDDRASAQVASPAAASMARGTGFRLGASEHSMEEIPNPNMHRATPARVTREITFWREGFTVGDGPFRRYDDSENFQLLSELKQGRVPVSFLDVEFGQDVDVTVVRKVDEDYVPPKSSLRGFVGQGQRLGSPVPGDTAERTVPEQEPAEAEPEPPSGDTAVQIRFANGKRLSHFFNATDSIESVYAFVRDHAFNDDTSRDFILSHAYPVKAIEAENATVESARLKNAVIVQRWKNSENASRREVAGLNSSRLHHSSSSRQITIPRPVHSGPMRAYLRNPAQHRLFGRGAGRAHSTAAVRKPAFFVPNDPAAETAPHGVYPAAEPCVLPPPGNSDTAIPCPRFLDPSMFLPHVVITDPAIENLAHSKTFRSATLWEQICHENTCEVLRVGSVVEFVAGGAEVQLGVVVAASAFQFHPLHSKMVVLTMNNELVRVHAQDATFVANEVFDARWVESLGVLHNRFNESFEARKRLVQLVHYFLACTRKYRATVDALMPQVYAHVASDDGASAVSLLKLVHTMSALHDTVLPDYLHQSAFLMAVHTHLCGDCVRWLVPGCVPLDRTTNLAFLGCSNSVPAAAVYFATPVHVMAQIAEFLGCDSRRLARFDALVAKTTAMKLPYDDLAIQWTIWDGKDLLPILDAVKYAAVYPHPRLLRKHAQCACLGKHPTQRTLYDFLMRLGLYNNPQNPLTDPVLSSGVLGPLAPGALAASSFRDRAPTTVAASAAHAVPTDHFVHLRTRKYFKDHVVYILPGKSAGMAVSVEKSNSRRYLINIHVADPATKISPSSTTFVEWARTTAHLVNWPDDSVVEKPSLMPDLKHIYFVPNDTLRAAEYFRVGDFDGRNDERELPAQFQSCMTLTFEYNPTLSDPLRDLTNKVQVTFDDISRTRIKRLDARTLDAGLVGSSPGLFRLFSRRPSSDSEPQLCADDQQNLSLLDAFFKVHFTLRNRNDAACALPPALGGILRKKHTLHASDGTIATHMELAAADRHARASFFVEEARVVAGALAAAYCSHHRVPAVFRDQQLINGANSGGGEGGKEEGVVIKHKNAFFPAFTARSYYDTAFARDPSGHLSTLAALFAYCHLGRERLVAQTAGQNTRHGLANGFVDVASAPESMEAYLNQLQVLAHVHQNATISGAPAADRLATKMTRFAHLKAFGYPVHGPMHLHSICSHLPDLEAARLGALYWQHRVHKYWVLRTLETRRECEITFTCTVTRVYRTDGSPNWSNFDVRRCVDVAVSAYCAQLGMEVHVLVPASTALTAGSEIVASEIVHVDAISGRLLLK